MLFVKAYISWKNKNTKHLISSEMEKYSPEHTTGVNVNTTQQSH